MVIYRKEIIFLFKFFTIFSICEFLILNLDFSLLENFIASSQAQFFMLTSKANKILVSEGSFEVTSSCTGLVSASVLASIIFSLKKPQIKQKIAIFLAGVILLLILNYFRVGIVIAAGKEFGLEVAEILHILSWFTTSVFVLALWYYFTKKITNVENFNGFL